MILQNVRRVVTLSASAVLIVALSLFCFFSCRQSGQTIRQLTNIKDSQVISIEVLSDYDTVTIDDQTKIKEFMRRFADGYRLRIDNTGHGAMSGDNGIGITLYLSNDKKQFVYIVASVSDFYLSTTSSKEPTKYLLINQADFIDQLNSYMKAIDPNWATYPKIKSSSGIG